MLDAAELLRASATDAAAVAQYLSSIDCDEVDTLLNAFTEAERKKKDDNDALEWRALVHLLLRTRATRQRTATRILQSLWHGHASEMEALRWVSEISLAYMASTTEQTSNVAAELRLVLQIVLQFVRDAIADAKKKALPPLLALVPVLLNLLADVSTAASETPTPDDPTPLSVVHEHVVQLLELPWDVRSVPYLLELLREHTILVSKPGWTQLRESIGQLVAASDLPTECINPLTRECWMLAAAAVSVHDETSGWIGIARHLLRRLPVHMRQEAEFNMQMVLHQYPSLTAVICDVLLESTDVVSGGLALDTSDAVLLLHVIRASKPLLHHHLFGSAAVPKPNDQESVFSKAQRLILSILSSPVGSSSASAVDKSLRHAVTKIVEYGGRQVHARIWKAQALHELARLWSDSHSRSSKSVRIAKEVDVGVLVIESIFSSVPEVREEILRSLFESSRVSFQAERALLQLRRLVLDHMSAITPYRQLFEDWLSTLASLPQHSSQLQAGFAAISPLVVTMKDLYNFAMVLLRKHLSSPHTSDRQLAVEVWCSWLESGLALDALQEEEVVLAIKHAVQLSYDREWTFHRLACMLRRHDSCSESNNKRHRLHDASLAEFHQLFASSLLDIVETETRRDDSSASEHNLLDESDDEDQQDATTGPHRHQFQRFDVSTLDSHFARNNSVAAALRLGTLLESIIECLVDVERQVAALGSTTSPSVLVSDGHLGRDFLRWLNVFTRHREELFQWVSSGGEQLRVGDPRFVWSLAARVSLGCAFCNLALRQCITGTQASSVKTRLNPQVWGLLESQLSIVRLWRKFGATTPMVNGTPILKEQELDPKVLQAIASTIYPFGSHILGSIATIVQESTNDNGSTASLDGILFLLDACSYSLSSPRLLQAQSNQTVSQLKALITIYSTVVSTLKTSTTDSTLTSATPTVFTTYSESIAAQFPTSMRHLVLPDSATAFCVTLDARAKEEILSRICVALTRGVAVLAENNQFSDLCCAVSALDLRLEGKVVSNVNVLGRIASRLLDEVRCVMGHEGYPKFRIASVALVRKLMELRFSLQEEVQPNRRDDDDDNALTSIADAAYEILCDHVVHQPPLLRGLFALSFPSTVQPARQEQVINRAAAVFAACGFTTDETSAEDELREQEPSVHQPQDELQPVRRRRLRQVSEDGDEEDEETIDSKDDRIHNDDNRADKQNLSERHSDISSSTHRVRQPRLTTSASQSAALGVVLTLLESIHTRAVSVLASTSKERGDEPANRLVLSVIARAVQIHELLSSSVFVSTDVSWINARTLARISSIVEAAVRFGKQCYANARRRNDPPSVPLLEGFTSSVLMTVRSRAWFALLRDAGTQPATKTKLSATILKFDVFLLDVPTFVASLMKSDTIPLEFKRRLRVFLSAVEADLARSISMATSRSIVEPENKKSGATASPSKKRHLVGVVPIVHTKRRKRLRSRHAFIDSCLAEEDGDDAFADLEDFIV